MTGEPAPGTLAAADPSTVAAEVRAVDRRAAVPTSSSRSTPATATATTRRSATPRSPRSTPPATRRPPPTSGAWRARRWRGGPSTSRRRRGDAYLALGELGTPDEDITTVLDVAVAPARRGGRRSAPTPARPAPTTTSRPTCSTSSSPSTGSGSSAATTCSALLDRVDQAPDGNGHVQRDERDQQSPGAVDLEPGDALDAQRCVLAVELGFVALVERLGTSGQQFPAVGLRLPSTTPGASGAKRCCVRRPRARSTTRRFRPRRR